jgi:hypothetical protein
MPVPLPFGSSHSRRDLTGGRKRRSGCRFEWLEGRQLLSGMADEGITGKTPLQDGAYVISGPPTLNPAPDGPNSELWVGPRAAKSLAAGPEFGTGTVTFDPTTPGSALSLDGSQPGPMGIWLRSAVDRLIASLGDGSIGSDVTHAGSASAGSNALMGTTALKLGDPRRYTVFPNANGAPVAELSSPEFVLELVSWFNHNGLNVGTSSYDTGGPWGSVAAQISSSGGPLSGLGTVSVTPSMVAEAAGSAYQFLKGYFPPMTNGATGPTFSPVAALGLGPQPLNMTTVVDDSAYPHDTTATAQQLPFADDLLVKGQAPPNAGQEMFRVPIGPDTRFVQVAFAPGEISATRTDKLWFYDQTGSALGNFTLTSGADRVVVGLRPTSVGTGSQIYVSVSSDQPSSSSSASDFLLQIQQVSDVNAEISVPALALAPLALSAGTTNPALALPDARSDATEGTEAENVAIGMGQNSGPLPVRGAGAAGGVFTDGEQTPPVSLHDAATVDLALVDLWPQSETELLGISPAALVGSAPWLGAALPAVVPMRGPGGEALWAAAQPSLTGTRRDPPAPLQLPIASAAVVLPESETTQRLVESAAEDQPPLLSSDRVVETGLAVAAVLSVGLVLPDAATLADSIRRRRLFRQALAMGRLAARG